MYGTVSWWAIPLSIKYDFKLALQNSPPLSDLTAATFKLSGLKKDSDAVMKFLRASAASDFLTKGIMLVHLVKPSTIVKKYFSPANPGTEIGPQIKCK